MLKRMRIGVGALILGLLCSGGAGAQGVEEQFPINGDVDVYVPQEAAPRPKDPGSREPVTAAEKAEVQAQLKELYEAYAHKDLDLVLKLLGPTIESSAQEYASRHKDNPKAAEEIRYAYKAFHRDIFNHKDYHLEPFTLEFCSYRKLSDGDIEVNSPVPVINSHSMDFVEDTEESTHYMTVSLRLGRFVFAPLPAGKKGWHLVEVDLF